MVFAALAVFQGNIVVSGGRNNFYLGSKNTTESYEVFSNK